LVLPLLDSQSGFSCDLYTWCGRILKPVLVWTSILVELTEKGEGMMKAKTKGFSGNCAIYSLAYSVQEWAKIGLEPIWLRLAGWPGNVDMVKGLLIPIHVDKGLVS
jgi:hypothetical protein